jgi:tetratricopeptide (TPR) repeat protein
MEGRLKACGFTIIIFVFTWVSSAEMDSPSEKRDLALTHLQRGVEYATKGLLYDRAIEEFKKALELDPDIPEVYCSLGSAYLGKGKLEEASNSYKQVLSMNPSSNIRGVANLCLGIIYTERKKFAEAVKSFEEAVRLIPDKAEAHYRLADIYVQQGKFDLAIPEYKRAIELDPNLAKPYQGLGLIYTKKGKADEAIRYYEEAIKRDPYDSASYYNMARCYFRLRKREEGRKMMEMFNRMKEYEEKVMSYKKAHRENPGNPMLHIELAQLHYEYGNLDEVIKEYEYAIYIAPDFAVAYNNLALAYLERNMFEKAKKAFQKTLELNPKAATAHLGLGQLYTRQGSLEQAEEHFKKAVELAPEYEPAYVGLVETYIRKGDISGAIETYARFVKVNPKSPTSWLRLGVLQLKGERFDEAEASFKRAMELDPDYAEAYNNLAWLYASMGKDLGEALRLARKAVTLKPIASHIDTLAWVYYKSGRYGEAEKEALRALELEPENEEYRKRLEEIRRSIRESGERR